ncbi:c-type cytochrome [Piscinibacter sp.]|uniref:c-type cytochrome n=1 Tax=Piscinibacter sp. TaxID=1903157 RepID=UPI00258C82CC|nr:c-type cytochrome [Piscinibacter sp.]
MLLSLRPLAALAALLLAAPAPAADLTRAVEIVEGKCFICHGAEGESSSPVFPRLAGQHASYVARQLADYQSGRRKNDTMQSMVNDLNAEDFRLLGMYFESKPTRAHPVADPELAQVGRFVYNRGNPYSGVAACADCHGAAGHGTDKLPRLGGQHAQYVETQLKKFSQRERTNDNAVMHTIASKLTELELKAVAAYVSGLQ